METLKKFKKNYLSIGFFGIAILVLLSGCSAKWGSYRVEPEVQQAFESRQVPADYQYFHYSMGNEPIVIFGIEPKYEMRSVMWKSVSADTEEFREMVGWIWEDYEYYKFGAEILDPDGKKIGIMYTSVHETAFKFGANNRITVIPHTPFLWGPDGQGGGSWR
jgi:hypothetical protein